MIGRNKKTRTARVDTVIGKTTSITGDLNFDGSLHVEGTIVGNVKSSSDENSTLVLDEDGMIEGEIDVANIIINGTVQGNIHSRGHAELMSKARIKGTVYYNLIEMAIGSEVNGNLVHSQEPQLGSVEYLDTGSNSENNS